MALLHVFAVKGLTFSCFVILNTGKPTRFEIMDTSGNRPLIKIRQSQPSPVTHEINENDVIKLKTSDDKVVVEIRVTGYVTDVDIL